MKASAQYIKIVEWSDEELCFVGWCPGVIGPCCHGDDETRIFQELCQIVDEWLEQMQNQSQPLPPPTAGQLLTFRKPVNCDPETKTCVPHDLRKFTH